MFRLPWPPRPRPQPPDGNWATVLWISVLKPTGRMSLVLRPPRVGCRGASSGRAEWSLWGRRRRRGVLRHRRGLAGRCSGGLGHRVSLIVHPVLVGGLRRGDERRHHCGCRRGGGIAVHGGSVLGPHLDVEGFGGHDCRGVLPEEVRRYQGQQQRTVSRNRRRRHRHRKRRLVGGDGGAGLVGGLLCLSGGRAEPVHIRRDRGHHCRRRRACPGTARQLRQRGTVTRGRDAQLRSQTVPGLRGRQQRPGSGTRIHPT